jgi:hypothetical protein
VSIPSRGKLELADCTSAITAEANHACRVVVPCLPPNQPPELCRVGTRGLRCLSITYNLMDIATHLPFAIQAPQCTVANSSTVCVHATFPVASARGVLVILFALGLGDLQQGPPDGIPAPPVSGNQRVSMPL